MADCCPISIDNEVAAPDGEPLNEKLPPDVMMELMSACLIGLERLGKRRCSLVRAIKLSPVRGSRDLQYLRLRVVMRSPSAKDGDPELVIEQEMHDVVMLAPVANAIGIGIKQLIVGNIQRHAEKLRRFSGEWWGLNSS